VHNSNRDVRKYGAIEWWDLMPRWYAKYKQKSIEAKEESLKAFLIAKANASKMTIRERADARKP